MSDNKQTAVANRPAARDPFTLLRQLTTEFDRVFERPFGLTPWPALPALAETVNWAPQIDVFERDHHLIAKVDLPGLKKDDVKVEVADGYLAISGERKSESEEKRDNIFRRERSYGSFYRHVPLPDGVKSDNVKATFADGVLEVDVALPAASEPKRQVVKIEERSAPQAVA